MVLASRIIRLPETSVVDEKDLRIIDLQPDDEDRINQAASLLFERFKERWPRAWADIESAAAEV